MAGEREYLRVPPDSTGKRVRLVHGALVAYSSKSSGYTWKTGREDYVFSTGSGDWAFHLHHVYEASLTSGVLDLSYSFSKMYDGSAPVAGDTIKDPDTGSVVATVVSVTDLYNNATNIVGYGNPGHGLEIDNSGSANVRFSEGLPQLDAFGKLRVSDATLLGDYIFANGYMPDKFSTNMSHMGSSISWDSNKRAALLTNDTASGSLVAHTSNTYHHYFPGSSHLFMCTLALGDSGKAGLGRSWGLFDFQNGFHFVHREYPLGSGTIKLGVVIKSDVTGSVLDTYIWQEDWNKDKLDGTGSSGMDIDVTKDNIYWIDVQWLGAGRVRFGTYYNGERIVCHEYYHGNNVAYSLSGTAALPVCFSQRNLAATGSTSEMRVFCASVWTESNIDPQRYGDPGQRSVDVISTATTGTYTYLATMAPIEKYSNGRVNRTIYYPTNLQVMAFDSVTGENIKAEIEVRVGSVLSGLNFQPINNYSPTVQYDTSATLYGGGFAIYKAFVDSKETFDLGNVYNNMTGGSVKNYAEKGGHRMADIANITNSSTAVITWAASETPFRETIAAVSEGVDRDTMFVYIDDVEGMTEINSMTTTYYLKTVGLNQSAIYTDKALTVPLDTSGFGTYTTSTGHAHGFYGTQFYWSLIGKKYTGANPARYIIKVGWKELRQ